jgi:beta-phosphoglucomutase-like phosphatase (HAD superfamily)
MIKGLTFDLEGTVVDVERFHHKAHVLAAKDAGISITIDDAIEKIPSFIGGPDSRIAKEFCQLSGTVSPERVRYILERDRYYYQHCLREADIQPRPVSPRF